MLPATVKVACIQLNSGDDKARNLEMAAALIAVAAKDGAKLVQLPENFAYIGHDESAKLQQAEDEHDSESLRFLSRQASDHKLLLIGGTVTLRTNKQPGMRNSCPVFAADGTQLASYDKMHLFDASLPGESYKESALVAGGKSPVSVDAGAWKLGLSVCYDLRFPELYRYYSENGCNILSIPAAFTVPTGEAHWEVLIRARAIENQSYVLAAGQCGTHPGMRSTWGHSMIVDPWGRILAMRHQGSGIVTAELRLDSLNNVRHTLPALKHRRLNA
jgi:nitrilase